MGQCACKGKTDNPIELQKNNDAEKKTFSWDQRKQNNVDDYFIKNQRNCEVLKLPKSIQGQQFVIQNCYNSEIYLLDHIDSVTVDDCENCTFIFGAVRGSVYLRGCLKVQCISFCGQFRTRDCQKCQIFIHSATQPIIESSTAMTFGSNLLDYSDLPGQLIQAKLQRSVQTWSEVYDFTAIENERNWKFIDDANSRFRLITRAKSTEAIMNTLAVTWCKKKPQVVVLESTV